MADMTLGVLITADASEVEQEAAKAEQARLLAVYMERKGYDRERKPQQYEKMQKFYRASCFFVELEDGMVLDIERPSIETRFCCGEDDRGQGGAVAVLAHLREDHTGVAERLVEGDLTG